MGAIRVTDISASDEVATGLSAWHVLPGRPDVPAERLVSVMILIPAPEGATTGTHRVGIGVRAGGPGAPFLTFSQASAPATSDLNVYATRPWTPHFEEDATFPKDESAFVAATQGIRFDAGHHLVVLYTNYTDAPQTGERTVLVLSANGA